VAYLSLPLQLLAVRRHHVDPASLQKAFKTAVGNADITKKASVHIISAMFESAEPSLRWK
jgi:hypothetical protein